MTEAWVAWNEGYSQAVADHKMRGDEDEFCDWPTTPNPYPCRSHATVPLAADQPPVCPDHREAQHRDGKPPWCDSCGWRHGEPARRYGNGRVVA